LVLAIDEVCSTTTTVLWHASSNAWYLIYFVAASPTKDNPLLRKFIGRYWALAFSGKTFGYFTAPAIDLVLYHQREGPAKRLQASNEEGFRQ